MKLTKHLLVVCSAIALTGPVSRGQQMGFGGPSILSGGGGAIGRAGGTAPLGMRPYLGVDFRYDSNLGDVGDSTRVRKNAYGLTGTWGLYGIRRGEGYILGIDYHGFYRQYSGARRNGINHFGTMSFVKQLSPTTDFFASLGLSVFRYGLTGNRMPLLPDVLPDVGDPDAEVFDSPTKAYRGSIGIRKVLSPRVAIQVGGGGFEIRRAANLISSRGADATGTVSYSIGPHKTVGVTYLFNYHFFPNAYGQTLMHNLSANYNQQLSPNWHFSGSAGVLRAANDRLVTVQLDPEIARLTGQSGALEASHRITFRPIYKAMFTRHLESGSLMIFYRRSSSPGNGFITSSLRENWGAAYSHHFTEKLHGSASFTGDSHVGVTQTVARYTTIGTGIAMSYKLFKMVHLNARVDGRHWVVSNSPLKRDRVGVLFGVVFSPGELPLSLW